MSDKNNTVQEPWNALMDLIKMAAGELGGQAFPTSALPWLATSVAKLNRPLALRVLKDDPTKGDTYDERTMQLELSDDDGRRHLITSYTKKVLVSDGYHSFTCYKTEVFRPGEVAPAETNISAASVMVRRIGEVDKQNIQEVTITNIGANGVQTVGPMRLALPAESPFAGLTGTNLLEAIVKPALRTK